MYLQARECDVNPCAIYVYIGNCFLHIIVAYSSTNIQFPFFYVYIRLYHGIGNAGDFGGYMVRRCLLYLTRIDVESRDHLRRQGDQHAQLNKKIYCQYEIEIYSVEWWVPEGRPLVG
jgi:hypothetical protein